MNFDSFSSSQFDIVKNRSLPNDSKQNFQVLSFFNEKTSATKFVAKRRDFAFTQFFATDGSPGYTKGAVAFQISAATIPKWAHFFPSVALSTFARMILISVVVYHELRTKGLCSIQLWSLSLL